jgi:hypothetical protein
MVHVLQRPETECSVILVLQIHYTAQQVLIATS